jgi:hypothetical protein
VKNLVIAIFISLLFTNYLYSQARVNAQLAVIKDTGKELKDVIGWSKNAAGQWRSSKNQIIGHGFLSHGIYAFDKLKLYNVEYKDNKYLLFEIVVKETGFEYTSSMEDKYNYRTSYYYILNENSFNISIKENENTNSIINVICSFTENEKWRKRFVYESIYSLPELITPKIENPVFIKHIIN